MFRMTTLRQRASSMLAWFAFVLATGALAPVVATAQGAPMDAYCSTSADAGARSSGGGTPLHHDIIKCPLCWSVAAAPPPVALTPQAQLHTRIAARDAVRTALHALAAGFEPARGPPRA